MKKHIISGFAERLRRQGITLVIIAAVLLELTSLVQYFFAMRGIREEAERRAESELSETSLRLDNITTSVETAINNVSWALTYEATRPDSLFRFLDYILKANPDIKDVAVGFVPDRFPEKGRWFEPISIRREDGSFENLVIGSKDHDYFEMEWFKSALESGKGEWSEPYYDDSGGKTMVVTYSMPVKNLSGEVVGVIGADLALDFLKELVESIKLYPHAYSTITSEKGQLLAAPAETLAVDDVVRYNTSFEDTGWKMSIVIPEDEIYKVVNTTSSIVALFQLLGLLFLIYIIQKTAKEQIKLKEVEDSNDKMENELRIARDIQMAMIPKTFPPFPERNDLGVAAAMYPAKEVGGDLYDFYIREEKLFFCVGDVSGKGIPAALVMAVTRSLFRTVSSHEKSPQKIVTIMNNSMSEINENSMFVTFFCGVLDLSNGHLRYCNAGHNAPFLFRDKLGTLPVEPNLPLGVMMGTSFKEQETDLTYDDMLFIYTDGLTEAENFNHKMFGEDRLRNVLSVKRRSQEQLDAMKAAVNKFVGEAAQSDDLTMLFIHFMNSVDPEESERHLILHNDIRQIPQLAGFVETIAEEMRLEQSLAMGINLALEEAVTNVIMYAYPEGSDGLVDIEAIMRKKSLDFVITDSGTAFDPTSVPVPDTSLEVSERPIGGLGIFLVRNIMDTVQYERKDGKNILSMTKKI